MNRVVTYTFRKQLAPQTGFAIWCWDARFFSSFNDVKQINFAHQRKISFSQFSRCLKVWLGTFVLRLGSQRSLDIHPHCQRWLLVRKQSGILEGGLLSSAHTFWYQRHLQFLQGWQIAKSLSTGRDSPPFRREVSCSTELDHWTPIPWLTPPRQCLPERCQARKMRHGSIMQARHSFGRNRQGWLVVLMTKDQIPVASNKYFNVKNLRPISGHLESLEYWRHLDQLGWPFSHQSMAKSLKVPSVTKEKHNFLTVPGFLFLPIEFDLLLLPWATKMSLCFDNHCHHYDISHYY